jgi:hypothetical protein
MKHRKYPRGLCFVVSEKTRAVLDRIAEEQEMGLGEVARSLLAEGIKARTGAEV